MTTNKLTEAQLLFRLQDFYGAEQDAWGIGDHEYAQECADIVSVIRELQEYRKAATADREMLKRLAVILSGSDAPGEIKALTVTAQSFVDRCKLLSRERDALRNTAGNSHEPSDR